MVKQATEVSIFMCAGCGDVHVQLLNGVGKVTGWANLSTADWDALVLQVEQQRALKAQEIANRVRI